MSGFHLIPPSHFLSSLPQMSKRSAIPVWAHPMEKQKPFSKVVSVSNLICCYCRRCCFIPHGNLEKRLLLSDEEPRASSSFLRGCPPTPVSAPPWGIKSLTGLGASSPTEARQGSPLLHMCQGPQSSLCMLLGWIVSFVIAEETEARSWVLSMLGLVGTWWVPTKLTQLVSGV